MPNFKFSLRKFQNLNFQFYNFMKQYSSNSNIIIITTYPCIYLYIQHLCITRASYYNNTFKIWYSYSCLVVLTTIDIKTVKIKYLWIYTIKNVKIIIIIEENIFIFLVSMKHAYLYQPLYYAIFNLWTHI